jgi:TolB-like protein/tRNA A-37 threonylcarbamoyl transferase component Bud32
MLVALTSEGSVAEPFDTLRDSLAERYALERELGRGGMATVFLAEDLKHRRKVAIKVLHPELAAAIGIERFLREIEIAARMQHPHILPLYDSGEAAGYVYYVMPFVEGESLRDRLNREKQLTQEDVIKITAEVASALGYAHSRDIVHRDIKPENIMLTGGSAVVADFGIARAASAFDQQQLTQTGTVIGTPAYMSPEQGTGSPVDGRSDQYSLACVVYEMLTGQPPFSGPNVQAIIARHTMASVEPPSIVRDSIPDTMEDALMRALSKVPADRFTTVIMFAEALGAPSRITASMRRISARTGERTLRPSLTVRLPVPAWRTLLMWGVPILVLLAVGWLTRGRWLPHRAPAAASRADPRRIAVLYFDDRSPDHSLAYLADGLTEALIHDLSSVSVLQVISRNGVAPYRHTAVTPDSLRRALGVGTLVDGTLAQSGDSLALSVSMTDAASGDEIDHRTLVVPRAEPMALQQSLANQVALFLRRRLGEEIQRVESRAGTGSTQAWELVQRAKELARNVDTLLAAGDTASATRTMGQADSLLARASSKDRRWITPVVERGWLAWEQRNIVGFEKGPAERWIDRGLSFAAQALALSPDDPEALSLRGTMRYIRWVLNLERPGEASQLLADARRDLIAGEAASNPNRASDLNLLSHLYMRNSDPVDGKLAAMQAYEVDPYLTEAADVLFRLYSASLDLEDAAEAGKWCEEGYRRFPDDPGFTECQISLYALKGEHPDVPQLWRLLDRNVALYPPSQRDYRRRRGELLVAMALANAGLSDSARAVAQRARAGADASVDPTHEFVYMAILLNNLLGDRDQALQLLKLYLATNPQDKADIARDSTWWFRGLRDDPEFKRLVRQ